MSKCTYKSCDNEGRHQQRGKSGNVWAKLCDEHAEQLDRVCKNPNLKALMSTYVKCKGGAEVCAKAMFDE